MRDGLAIGYFSSPGVATMQKKIWILCLAVWFLFYALFAISNVRFEMQAFLMGLLALAVAVLAIVDR